MESSEERSGVSVKSIGGGLVVVGLVSGEGGGRRLREVKSFLETKLNRRCSRLLKERVGSGLRSERSVEGVIIITYVVTIWLRAGILHDVKWRSSRINLE